MTLTHQELKEIEDRLDSGMTATERGIPYTMEEVKIIPSDPRFWMLSPYYKEVITFLIRRVERLQKIVDNIAENPK